LRNEVIGFKKIAKEEQKKRLVKEAEVDILKERIEMLEMEKEAWHGKNL
jgi:hypothetical protein